MEYGGSRLLPTSKTDEKAKVVLRRSIPFVEFFVHTLAVGTIAVLAWLNLIRTSWVDFDIDKNTTQIRELKGWQVLSKVHELFMLSSLSYIIFYYMRRLLIGKYGVLFGLLNATYQVSSPSMVYKHGAWTSAFSANRSFSILLFIMCYVSIVLVPASAILMIPSAG